VPPCCAVATLACSARLCRALRSLCPDTARTLPGLPVACLGLKPCSHGPRSLFADPFAGFNGVERFKRNVSNLGGLMCGPAHPTRPVVPHLSHNAPKVDGGARHWPTASDTLAARPAGLVPLWSRGAAGAQGRRRCCRAARVRAGRARQGGRAAGADGLGGGGGRAAHALALQRRAAAALAAAPGGRGRHHARLQPGAPRARAPLRG